jgi:hypothetical protein
MVNHSGVGYPLFAALSILCASGGLASAADNGPGQPAAAPLPNEVIAKTSSASSAPPLNNEELLKKLELMEKRVQTLEGQLKQKSAGSKDAPALTAAAKEPPKKAAASGGAPWWAAPAGQNEAPAIAPAGTAGTAQASTPEAQANKPILGLVDSPVAGLSIGAYGEIKYGFMQNPAANGQWQNGFDAHRMVLLPTYQITPNIIFNAEIEFEHGGIAFDADDKRHGTAEIEQIWIDFKIKDYFNIRSPGIDLVPIGYINQHHEPTQFYSVNRPELYNGLIPSTWMVPSSSVYGTVADGLSYQVQASSSIEDFGDSFDKRTSANKVAPGGYAPGIDGLNGLGFSHPPVGSFSQLSNAMAVAAKLDYSPPFLPGFAGSVSGYYTPNTTPRGAYSDTGKLLGDSSLAMFDAEFRYRIPDTGLELRGEGVYVTFGNPANLRANNDSDPTNNAGKSMYGASGEIAYHIPLGTFLNSEWEAVPFYRYTYENLQTGGFAGTDANTPTGAGQLQFHTAGVAVFPSPKLALKATYQHVQDNEPGGAKSDSILGAVGFFF